MSDATLRTLERRWKDSRAIEDESRFLLGKVRTGELPQVNLRLAAILGHPPSIQSMGPGPQSLRVKEWVWNELRPLAGAWFNELLLRATHAAAWVSTIHYFARTGSTPYPWMDGATGRAFQLSAFRILSGEEPDPSEVITPLQMEMMELHAAITEWGRANSESEAADTSTALRALRYAAARYATPTPEEIDKLLVYTLRWAEHWLGTDGVFHATGYLVGPYLTHGEDPMLWWREEVRTLYPGVNLYIARSPWFEDAVAKENA